MIGPILIIVATVAVTELTANLVHRHIMHGSGWEWHRSHHEPHDGVLEKNDLYAVFFAGVSVGLIVAARFWPPALWMGIGMIVYGVLYSLVHDGLVHQRWPFRHVPRRGYLKRLYQAHKLHHAVEGRTGCVSFGFLYAAPVGRLKQQLQSTGPETCGSAMPPASSARSSRG